MREQRRHQRIRFNAPPPVRVGQRGLAGVAALENLSLGGLLLRTSLPLRLNEMCGCEFLAYGAPLIDLSALVVSRLGDLYGLRFLTGPVSERLIQSAIDQALDQGKASTLTINELQGRKVMRVVGGLNSGLRNDFVYGLNKVGVRELDLSEVTEVDGDGIDLCRMALGQFNVAIIRSSPCVRSAMGSRGVVA